MITIKKSGNKQDKPQQWILPVTMLVVFMVIVASSVVPLVSWQTTREPSLTLNPKRMATLSREVDVGWAKLFMASENHESTLSSWEYFHPKNIVILGLFVAFLLSCFMYLSSRSRQIAMRNQAEKTIDSAKSDFLALASHQLRTPATGIKQYLGLLLEGYAGRMTKRQRDFIEQAYESNERQINVVNQMLFVARVDSGNFIPELSRVSLTTVLQDIVNGHRIESNDKKLSVSFHIPERDVFIQANESFLYMALENIVNNAIKYTLEGGKIRISLSEGRDSVKVKIQDNGIGVSKEDMSKVFQKFSRVDSEHTSRVSGSGIGLYLSSKIIQSHGGSIDFSSKKDVGSIVSVHLPRKPKQFAK